MLDSRTARGLIHPRMPVVGSNHVQHHDIHHDIPLTWVTSVDDKIHAGIHADRSGDQAMRAWTTTPPAKA